MTNGASRLHLGEYVSFRDEIVVTTEHTRHLDISRQTSSGLEGLFCVDVLE